MPVTCFEVVCTPRVNIPMLSHGALTHGNRTHGGESHGSRLSNLLVPLLRSTITLSWLIVSVFMLTIWMGLYRVD